MADLPALPSSSVAAFTTGFASGRWAGRDLADVDDHVIAALVHLRLRLERSLGWWVFGGVLAALASVVVVGIAVDSRLTFGAWAAAVASGTVGLGVAASWLQSVTFRRAALQAGLSAAAAEQLFLVAADTDHWLAVIEHCGLTVTAGEVASFVRQH